MFKKNGKAILCGTAVLLGISGTSIPAFATENTEFYTLQEEMLFTDSAEESSDAQGTDYGVEPAWLFTKTYKCIGSDVRIRKKPNTNSGVWDYLQIGDKVTVKSIDGGWAKILYSKGSDGYAYVYAEYLVEC